MILTATVSSAASLAVAAGFRAMHIPVLDGARIRPIHGISYPAQDQIHVETRHGADGQRQIANADAELAPVDEQVCDTAAQDDRPDDGDGQVQLGQAVEEGLAAIMTLWASKGMPTAHSVGSVRQPH